MVKYAYTSCVRARLAYASFAFARSLTKGQTAKLSKLQRTALTMTSNMRKGTPTSALEVIMDIPPINLFLKAEATKAGYRLIGTSDDQRAEDGHLVKGQSELDQLEIPTAQGDYQGKERIWEQNYAVSHMGKGNDILHGHRCYTDGSRTTKGTGSGVCIMDGSKVTKTRAIGLTNHATVFQAEMQAIRLGCSQIKDAVPKGESITILSDSQAAIKALQNIDTTSNLVKCTKEALNQIGKEYDTTIHVNNKGKGIADRDAKTGSLPTSHTEIRYGKAHVKRVINNNVYSFGTGDGRLYPTAGRHSSSTSMRTRQNQRR